MLFCILELVVPLVKHLQQGLITDNLGLRRHLLDLEQCNHALRQLVLGQLMHFVEDHIFEGLDKARADVGLALAAQVPIG